MVWMYHFNICARMLMVVQGQCVHVGEVDFDLLLIYAYHIQVIIWQLLIANMICGPWTRKYWFGMTLHSAQTFNTQRYYDELLRTKYTWESQANNPTVDSHVFDTLAKLVLERLCPWDTVTTVSKAFKPISCIGEFLFIDHKAASWNGSIVRCGILVDFTWHLYLLF